MKSTEFRIFGAELGETDSYIDATVNAIDKDGAIYFADSNTDREWSLTNREIQRLLNQNLMIESGKVQENKLWKLANKIYEKGIGNASEEFAVENVEDAQRSVFLAAYFESR